RRAALWERYDELLSGLPLETPPGPTDEMRHARHLYQVLVELGTSLSRDDLLDALTAQKIGTGVHYRGVHLHPYYRETFDLKPEQFPVATDISNRTLSLPFAVDLTAQDQQDVVDALELALRPATA